MENKEDDIKDLFRERFENEEADISPRVWQNIKKTLPEEKQPFIFWFSSNIILWSIAGVLSLSAGIGAFIIFHQRVTAVPAATASSSSVTTVDTLPYNSPAIAETLDHYPSKEDSVNFNILPKSSRKVKQGLPQNSSAKKTPLDPALFSSGGNNNKNSINKRSAQTHYASNDAKDAGHLQKKNSSRHKSGANKFINGPYKENKNHSTDSLFVSTTSPSDLRDNEPLRSYRFTSPQKNNANKSLTDPSDSILNPLDTLAKDNRSPDTTFTDKNSFQFHSPSIISDSLPGHSTNEDRGRKENSHFGKGSLSNPLLFDTANHSAIDSSNISSNRPAALSDSALTTDSLQTISKDSALATTTGEKEKSKSGLMNRFSIDFTSTSLLTGASTRGLDSLHQSAVAEKNKHDKNSWGYSAGIMVNYKLSHKLHASSGIFYTAFSEQYSFNYNLKKTNWVLIDSTWQPVQVDSINRDIKVKDRYSFISVPLQLSYTFLVKEKIKISVVGGVRANILLQGVTYLPNAQKSDVAAVRSGFNSVSFTYLIALEAAYKLGTRTSLILQPTFMYAASSVHSKASGLNQKPYGVGITLGLRFTF